MQSASEPTYSHANNSTTLSHGHRRHRRNRRSQATTPIVVVDEPRNIRDGNRWDRVSRGSDLEVCLEYGELKGRFQAVRTDPDENMLSTIAARIVELGVDMAARLDSWADIEEDYLLSMPKALVVAAEDLYWNASYLTPNPLEFIPTFIKFADAIADVLLGRKPVVKTFQTNAIPTLNHLAQTSQTNHVLPSDPQGQVPSTSTAPPGPAQSTTSPTHQHDLTSPYDPLLHHNSFPPLPRSGSSRLNSGFDSQTAVFGLPQLEASSTTSMLADQLHQAGSRPFVHRSYSSLPVRSSSSNGEPISSKQRDIQIHVNTVSSPDPGPFVPDSSSSCPVPHRVIPPVGFPPVPKALITSRPAIPAGPRKQPRNNSRNHPPSPRCTLPIPRVPNPSPEVRMTRTGSTEPPSASIRVSSPSIHARVYTQSRATTPSPLPGSSIPIYAPEPIRTDIPIFINTPPTVQSSFLIPTPPPLVPSPVVWLNLQMSPPYSPYFLSQHMLITPERLLSDMPGLSVCP
ncbi:hypothetical protein K435DRAFT_523128 [Dendrothele bispora CBS 962.96]|uniref:Uncharacterized protein n=1 Tax=Dendrothele bispora (strain CBS 962.96) TaxID=1314807 RepID=A0A4S8KUX1_DENBC|nr:hypothetical protein K435DRAFT_523128 [Dendrothele bispora CBS 962.96]